MLGTRAEGQGLHSSETQRLVSANTCPKEDLTAIGPPSLLEEETRPCPFCRLSGHAFQPRSFLVIYRRGLSYVGGRWSPFVASKAVATWSSVHQHSRELFC